MPEGNEGRYVSVKIPATPTLVSDLIKGKDDQDGKKVCAATYDRIVRVDLVLDAPGDFDYGGKDAQTIATSAIVAHPNLNWYRTTYVRSNGGELSATAVIAMR